MVPLSYHANRPLAVAARTAALLSLSSLVLACGGGGGGGPAATPEHTHVHGAHAPLVHRFQSAEEWAKQFDDPARDEWQKPAEVVAALRLEPGMTVADLGAGTGYFEPLLSRGVGAAGIVLALDVEPDMVRYLGERAQREHLANVRPGLVATDDPKLAPESVDRILVVDVWHHIDARDAYAAKLRGALKPGGKVFVVDFELNAKHGPPPMHRLSSGAVERELAAAGLATETLTETLPDQYIVVGTRR
jgi:predicted methyltransferase